MKKENILNKKLNLIFSLNLLLCFFDAQPSKLHKTLIFPILPSKTLLGFSPPKAKGIFPHSNYSKNLQRNFGSKGRQSENLQHNKHHRTSFIIYFDGEVFPSFPNPVFVLAQLRKSMKKAWEGKSCAAE